MLTLAKGLKKVLILLCGLSSLIFCLSCSVSVPWGLMSLKLLSSATTDFFDPLWLWKHTNNKPWILVYTVLYALLQLIKMVLFRGAVVSSLALKYKGLETRIHSRVCWYSSISASLKIIHYHLLPYMTGLYWGKYLFSLGLCHCLRVRVKKVI